MTIEPGVSLGGYIVRTRGFSFLVYVKPGSSWDCVVAAAQKKLAAMRLADREAPKTGR